MGEEKPYKLVIRLTCEKCGKDYGKSNLTYQGCEIWIACDCHPEHLAVFIDPNKIDFGAGDVVQVTDIH